MDSVSGHERSRLERPRACLSLRQLAARGNGSWQDGAAARPRALHLCGVRKRTAGGVPARCVAAWYLVFEVAL